MKRRRFICSLLLFVVVLCTLPTEIHLIPLLDSNRDTAINNTHFLQDVLKEISQNQNWDFEAIKSSSKLRVTNISVSTAQRYDFVIRFGKLSLIFKFPDEVDSSWSHFNGGKNASFGDFVKEIGSIAALDAFKVDGPFDLRVGHHDHLSLSLPLNVSHSNLKRILVDEGVTVEIREAKQLSFFHTFDSRFNLNASSKSCSGIFGSYSISRPFCTPLLPIRVFGSASVIAYMTRNPDAPVRTSVVSNGRIKLLPEKCYSSSAYKNWVGISDFLSTKIDRLGKLLGVFLRTQVRENSFLGFLRTNVIAATVIHFQLEVERNLTSNVSLRAAHDDWRTQPTIERFWFQVLARVEDGNLRPISVKKVMPFMAVDTVSWSNIMSNISFTKFSSILVPPEPLTLDVKW